MAESIPNITLTDPQNQDAPPSPAQSPMKSRESCDGTDVESRVSGRPVTPGSSSGRPGSSTTSASAWPSPGKLRRTLSNHARSSSDRSRSPQPIQARDGAKDEPQQSAMDPLSQHIMKRTHAPMDLPSTNRPTTAESSTQRNGKAAKETSPAPAARDFQSPGRSETSGNAQKELKRGVKAVSFLSKIMGSAKKKEAEDAAAEQESVSGEDRPEGTDAAVFAEPADNMGYSPRHPQPPAYIKVRSKHKQKREFDRLFLAQELECRKRRKLDRQGSTTKLRRKSSATPSNAETVWAMEFSKDGRHLAAAGVDTVVRVWAVLASLTDRQTHERQEASQNEANGSSAHAEHLSAPVFQSQPVREYEGHTATVLDLSWSKNNFLLSSSMDKTVRLWHVSRPECLCTFKHSDFVPSISFHPKDDRFFLAGSLDSKLRLWSIPDKSVAYAAQVPEMITAVAFTPDGKYTIAGCLSGLCMFFETEGLKYNSQMHVRSSRGQNAKGSKITNIQASYAASGDIKLLITSNDSRIRVYNFRDKSLELKLKGNENNCSQIRAQLSDCGRYVTCGSEDRKAYLWSLGASEEGEKRDKRPMEMFEASSTITTAVCMAPAKTRVHLSKSEDPVYDLCNPPPVTLMSRAERTGSVASSKHSPTENGSARATPTPDNVEKPQPSPAYLAKVTHKEGNIIVTADFTGRIKVFRQDCAWSKRKADDWDKSSIFTKRTAAGRSSRAGSLATKASQRSLREPRSSTSTQPPGERIMSWRQGVASTSAISANGSAKRSSSKHTSRSVSPSKSLEMRPKPLDRNGSVKSAAHPLSEVNTAGDGQHDTAPSANGLAKEKTSSDNGIEPDMPKYNEDNPLMIQGGQSNAFWDPGAMKDRMARLRKLHKENDGDNPDELHRLTPVPSANEGAQAGNGHLAVRPPMPNGQASYVSRLSDERSTDRSSEGEFDDAPERLGSEASNMHCRRCGGPSFSVKRGKDGGTRLCCTQCGTPA